MLSSMPNSVDEAFVPIIPEPQQYDGPPPEDPGWEDQFKNLRAYQLQFGHSKVPARFKANPKLGRWVMTQRRQFTLLMQGMPSALNVDRVRRLENMGFTWSMRPEPAATWHKRFEDLKGKTFEYKMCAYPYFIQLVFKLVQLSLTFIPSDLHKILSL